MPNSEEPMMGTIQCTFSRALQPNQKSEIATGQKLARVGKGEMVGLRIGGWVGDSTYGGAARRRRPGAV